MGNFSSEIFIAEIKNDIFAVPGLNCYLTIEYIQLTRSKMQFSLTCEALVLCLLLFSCSTTPTTTVSDEEKLEIQKLDSLVTGLSKNKLLEDSAKPEIE